ncbi:uncharacterized protein PAC_07983 [Phialocephala subalpina]|uniref:Uncharacterized protein n=1 Tax=Phialocephala subalpina TaxID=576137 RepID=A0A1L7WZ92_9HELO|nr:uncharacterized protein PAC_07983 [Phialocephala subalpina]
MAAKTGLTAFPAELLVLITNHLPAESSAAFTLTCKVIGEKLGLGFCDALKIPDSILEKDTDSFWRTLHEALGGLNLQAKRDRRHEFLCLLEKDLPSHIYCRSCQKLHKVDVSLVGHPWFENLHCMKKDRESNIHKSIHEAFRYPFFQMLMKRHRLGLNCTDLLNIFRYNMRESRSDHMYQGTAEARIISDALYIRAQHVFMLPASLLPNGPEAYEIAACSHFTCNETRTFVSGELTAAFRRRLHHLPHCHGPDCSKCFASFLSCIHCQTEFQIDIKDLGEGDIALVLTKWQALGKGEDHKDLIWLGFTGDGASQFWETGSISRKFENGKPFRFDSLLLSSVPSEGSFKGPGCLARTWG